MSRRASTMCMPLGMTKLTIKHPCKSFPMFFLLWSWWCENGWLAWREFKTKVKAEPRHEFTLCLSCLCKQNQARLEVSFGISLKGSRGQESRPDGISHGSTSGQRSCTAMACRGSKTRRLTTVLKKGILNTFPLLKVTCLCLLWCFCYGFQSFTMTLLSILILMSKYLYMKLIIIL